MPLPGYSVAYLCIPPTLYARVVCAERPLGLSVGHQRTPQWQTDCVAGTERQLNAHRARYDRENHLIFLMTSSFSDFAITEKVYHLTL